MRSGALAALEKLRNVYGADSGAQKRSLLQALERARLATSREVLRLHEMLLFLRAYPDDARTFRLARRMLRNFASRRDVRAHRDALENTGVAGASIRFPFFWPTARWLAKRWPKLLKFDRLDRTADRAIGKLFGVRSGFRKLDAVRFLEYVGKMPGDDFAHEAFYDALEPVLELLPGENTPSRTLESHRVPRIAWQRGPISHEDVDLAAEVRRPPRRVRSPSPHEARRLIELARTIMATRARDLDAFAYGDPRDVRMVEDEDALAFAVIGIVRERRKAGIAAYGFLILRNGFPLGYGDLAPAGSHVEVAFNLFPTYRGTQAGKLFARTLAAVRRVFGARTFGIAPYQLGHENREAIDSGAWWFYTKLGLRARAAGARRLARRELRRRRLDRAYRSSAQALERLARWPLYYRYH